MKSILRKNFNNPIQTNNQFKIHLFVSPSFDSFSARYARRYRMNCECLFAIHNSIMPFIVERITRTFLCTKGTFVVFNVTYMLCKHDAKSPMDQQRRMCENGLKPKKIVSYFHSVATLREPITKRTKMTKKEKSKFALVLLSVLTFGKPRQRQKKKSLSSFEFQCSHWTKLNVQYIWHNVCNRQTREKKESK